jgi:hypothetical protein
MMLRKHREAIRTTARNDLIVLIEEYARQGDELTRGDRRHAFERMWRATFHPAGGSRVVTGEEAAGMARAARPRRASSE